MYPLLRPLLFKLRPETSHDLVMNTLGLVSKSKQLTSLCAMLVGAKSQSRPAPTQSVQAMGITFPNPVGLAAGLDKQANACNALHKMGFGWLELGTVTPLPQPGNPKPRMFRLPEHQALINRLGFNSVGLTRFVNNLARADPEIIIGINIGKNAATPLNNAIEDYLIGLRGVYAQADYVAINVSSPNTRDLRNLQQHQALNQLLYALNLERQKLTDSTGKHVPLVVKIAPDLDRRQIDGIAAILRRNRIDGVAATNTTLARRSVEQHPLAHEVGGLSGPPLDDAATATVAALYQNLQGEIPIIGIGGIDSAQAALEKFQAGAKLVQIYTGFIYQGPRLIKAVLDALAPAAGK
ncbi:quinone-dependent dihydroorotate dehydrogenase [Candidatus Spongiihabitans sp.]|uniref:quinone-dependent dihydroorotate dehydrogenase n=1 Tax=Candidatus Spongiihabitans sp. TaxID=3101308 RepID=UPI003C7B841C